MSSNANRLGCGRLTSERVDRDKDMCDVSLNGGSESKSPLSQPFANTL